MSLAYANGEADLAVGVWCDTCVGVERGLFGFESLLASHSSAYQIANFIDGTLSYRAESNNTCKWLLWAETTARGAVCAASVSYGEKRC
jgi:hypothetical protein